MSKKNEKKDEKVVPVENLETMKDAEVKGNAAEKDNVAEKDDAAVKTGIVNCDKLRVRKGPSTDAEIISYLKKGDEVLIESEDNKDFYKISAGFVMKEFVSIKI